MAEANRSHGKPLQETQLLKLNHSVINEPIYLGST